LVSLDTITPIVGLKLKLGCSNLKCWMQYAKLSGPKFKPIDLYPIYKFLFMLYFDDFKIGDKFTSRSRIITTTDVDLFTGVTGAVNPLFLSDEAARRRGFEGRITPGLLVLSIAVGLLYQIGLFDNIIALLGISDLRFTSPVRPGEEVSAECEVAEKKEVKTGDRGIVKLKITCKNITKNSISIEGFITLLYPKKPV